MKKKLIIGIVILILIGVGAILYFKPFKGGKILKEPVKTVINPKDDATAVYGSFVNPSEFINELTDGELVDNDLVLIDEYPTKTIAINYLDNNKDKKTINVNVNVIDEDKPIIMNARTITVKVGEEPDFKNNVMIGDNADRNPKVEVVGDYNINKVGTYSVRYVVTDAAGNQNEQWFKINVVREISNGGNYTPSNGYAFSTFKNEYKNDNSNLGIDVSKWQGDINWNKVKDAGCEFAIIRVGYQYGKDGELKVDPYFKANIEGANKVGIPVGIYFYSYAGSKEDATNQAKWIAKHLKGYQVDYL